MTAGLSAPNSCGGPVANQYSERIVRGSELANGFANEVVDGMLRGPRRSHDLHAGRDDKRRSRLENGHVGGLVLKESLALIDRGFVQWVMVPG